MPDFTVKTFTILLEVLSKQGFSFQTFSRFIQHSEKRLIVLRHDGDKLLENTLNMAHRESELGIKGTYYFRTVPFSYDEEIIRQVAELGHEVGYHYEDASLAAQRQKTKAKRQKVMAQGERHRAQELGNQDLTTHRHNTITKNEIGRNKYVVNSREYEEEDYERYMVDLAIESFVENLERLRKIVPVKTVCMHGSPMSRWDSRLLWKYYDYRDFGIIGEPYFDINFDEMLYLTDTGRRWDGSPVNIRDKASGIGRQASGRKERGSVGEREIPSMYSNWKVKPLSGSLMNMTPAAIDFQSKYKFRSTFDIIKAAEEGRLPDKIMMTFHPQRWTNSAVPWVREFVWQNVKNVGKYFLIRLEAEGGRQ